MMLSKKKLAKEKLLISERKVDDLNARCQIPAPVRIGRSVRWRESDIRLWVELGCPNRETFEAAKERRCTNGN